MSSDTIFREYRPSDAERSDRSAGDRLRHRQKVRESIRENIADIIAEESIIGKNKDKVIKVPLRGIRFGSASAEPDSAKPNQIPARVSGASPRRAGHCRHEERPP